MTMLLQYSHPAESDKPPVKTVLKLRFSSRRDFWTFAAHSTFARIRGYASGWVEGSGGYAGTEQHTLTGALGSSGL